MRIALVLASLIGVTVALTPVALAQPARPRIVVLETPTTHAPSAFRPMVMGAVESANLVLVPETRLGDGIVRCEFPACLPKIAKTTGATHVLRVDASLGDEQFKILLELWDARSGRLVVSDSNSCIICDEGQFLSAAAKRTEEMLKRALHDQALSNSAESQPGSELQPRQRASDPIAPPRDPRPADPDSSRWRPVPLWSGLALLAVGLGGFGAALHYESADGDPVCKRGEVAPCELQRETTSLRNVYLAGGALAALGGAFLVFKARPQTETTVSLGPAGLVVAGRF